MNQYFPGIELVLFLGTAFIGFGLESYMPGGANIAGALSCFFAADLAWVLVYFLGILYGVNEIQLRYQDFLWLGIGAGLGCLLGMFLGGVIGGFTYLMGPVLGGVGAVLAFKYKLFYI